MSHSIERLLAVMAQLRNPDGGCPWDLEQNFHTIAPYTIEEAYEVADAIEMDDRVALKDELGDLLFQVVFHARMAEEEGSFAFNDVVAAIIEKMERRHPHVFADASERSAQEQTQAWEEIKARERADKGIVESALDGIPGALPAATRALKLQKRAARVGFDWNSIPAVESQIEEEVAELVEAVTQADKDAIEDEFGDLMFCMVNLARHLDVDAEKALRRCNAKFERRFRFVEQAVAANGQTMDGASLDEMEKQWKAAKRHERGQS
ncbi:MAG: nucleoside triphosphate pyrophosphohydrolase [Alphaproteobacteria bacterium]